MGRFVTATVLSLCIALCLVSCKTTRQTETQNDIRKEYNAEYLLSRTTGVFFTDSLQERINQVLSGRLTFWSKPDSTGAQHKVADMDFSSATDIDRKQGSNLSAADTASLHKKVSANVDDKSKLKEDESSDSRIINNNLLAWIIGSGVLALLVWFIIKWQNRKK